VIAPGQPAQAFSTDCRSSGASAAPADRWRSSKHLRRTRHTHHPVDDARGNAEALLHMKEALGLKIAWD
jgi:hypothetical protein